ncbi:MAG: nucleoside-diphosphate kinase [Desulfurobacteriaceae bacterium]
MAVERTLVIVKPDAVKKNAVGDIVRILQENDLKLLAIKMVHLTKEQAKKFYIVHKDRPFYDELTDFMSSGPCVPMVLEGEDAISRVREIIGATDPAKAAEGTIRKKYGTDVGRNAVHASDSPESAAYEIPFFFNQIEIHDQY